VWITRGMMRFVKNDDELALVVAHEMAHAYLGHIVYVRVKQVLEAALGLATEIFAPGSGRTAVILAEAATKKFDRDQEREADLFGLIWAYHAGFDVSAARVCGGEWPSRYRRAWRAAFFHHIQARPNDSLHRESCEYAAGGLRPVEDLRLHSAARLGLAEKLILLRDARAGTRCHTGLLLGIGIWG
jgi:beta-barrel assembly-enhancing protease